MITGVAWLAATKALGQVITWLITLAVVRLLTPLDYGLMGMAGLFAGFLLLFNELGLGAAIVQNGDLTKEDIADLRWAILGLNFVLFLFVVVCAPVVAAYFGEPALTPVARALSVGFLISGIGAPSGFLLQRELAFEKKSRAELIGNVVAGLTTLVCALQGMGIWSLVTGSLVQQAAIAALYCAHSPVTIVWRFSARNVSRFLSFGLQVTAAKVLWYFSTNADFLVVGRVLGAIQLGFYSLAFQFSSLPIDKIVTIVTQVAFPSFSALQHDDDTLRRYYLRLVSTVAFITFPMFMGLFLAADVAVAYFLTPRWAAVVLPLKILCVVSCLRAIEALNGPLLLARGAPGVVLFNNLLQAVLMPVAFYLGARDGLTGVAVSWLVIWPGLFAVVTWQTLRLLRLPVSAYLGCVRHAAIGSALMTLIVTAMQQRMFGAAWHPLLYLGATGVAGCASYVAYIALFDARTIREASALIHSARQPRAAAVVARAERPDVAISSGPAAPPPVRPEPVSFAEVK